MPCRVHIFRQWHAWRPSKKEDLSTLFSRPQPPGFQTVIFPGSLARYALYPFAQVAATLTWGARLGAHPSRGSLHNRRAVARRHGHNDTVPRQHSALCNTIESSATHKGRVACPTKSKSWPGLDPFPRALTRPRGGHRTTAHFGDHKSASRDRFQLGTLAASWWVVSSLFPPSVVWGAG